MTGWTLGALVVACSGSTANDTGSLPSGAPPAWVAPEHRDDAYNFTVPESSGLVWERDLTFRIEGFSVPQVFRAPDGRFGMTVTRMDPSDDFAGQSVLWSDDGMTWEDGGALIGPDDFPYDCGEQLRDNTVWREPGRMTFVLAGGAITGIGEPLPDPVHLCAASTLEFDGWSFDSGPMFSGDFEQDIIGVPAVLEFEEEGPHLWYNGDLQAISEEGPGIRVAQIDGESRTAETVVFDPILSRERVDPSPVYVEGGGVRLYHTDLTAGQGQASIRAVDLDADLAVIGEDRRLLVSDGECGIGAQKEGRCLVDPTFVRLEDGRMFLYFGDATYSDATMFPGIGRAQAVD